MRKLKWRGLASRFFFAGTRLAFGAFLLLTSVYCLLVWVPFSYFSFIRNPLVSWLPVFVSFHGLIYGALLTAVALTLIPDLRQVQTRRIAAAFLLLNAGAAVYLWRENALAALQPDFRSYIWSMLCLFPLLWLAAIDLCGKINRPRQENSDRPRRDTRRSGLRSHVLVARCLARK
jgi:hypothetical protein